MHLLTTVVDECAVLYEMFTCEMSSCLAFTLFAMHNIYEILMIRIQISQIIRLFKYKPKACLSCHLHTQNINYQQNIN